MTATMKKTLLISLAIFLTIIGVVGVVYLLRKPGGISNSLPTAAPVFVVEQQNACNSNFIVACGTPTPTPSSPSTPTPSSSLAPSIPASAPPVPSPSPSMPPSAALDCTSKRMYEDDSRNRAGFYYLEKEVLDTNTLSNGQTVIYNVVTRNGGGNSVPDTTITDKLSANLTYIDGDSGCTYDATTRVVTCTIGTLSPSSEAQRSFRVKVVDVTSTVSVANTAEVMSTNGQRDTCSIKIDARGIVQTPQSPTPTSLPQAGIFEVTALPLGIGLLLLLFGALGLLLI